MGVKHLDGYKAIIAYVEHATGVSYSPDAMRMIINRDEALSKARTWFNGMPRIATGAIDAWVSRAAGRKRRRTRYSA